jgi:glycosyltransferase involved in cell wall biosynthesis
MSDVLVALPAYNEVKHIGKVIDKVKKYSDRIMVVDDGSTDGTASRVHAAGVVVHRFSPNSGYGVTMQRILSLARVLCRPEVLVVLDADGQHDPADIPAMVDAVGKEYDLVIGCRDGRDVPFYRRIGGTILSVATWVLSGVWVRDSQCGFRAYSRRAVEMIKPRETGMAVSSEIIGLAVRAGLKIKEVPIKVQYLEDSSTHNPWRQGFCTLWQIVVMIVRRRLGK